MKQLLILILCSCFLNPTLCQELLNLDGDPNKKETIAIITNNYSGMESTIGFVVEVSNLSGTAGRFEGGQIGILGTSTLGFGIFGQSVNGTGIRGYSENQWGINGESTNSIGVLGSSMEDYGLRGESIKSSGVYADARDTNQFDVVVYTADGSKGYGTISSKRWKSNIRNIPNSLEKLSLLRGVYYNWDTDHGGRHDIGFIAEEIGKVVPEIVSYEQNGVDAIGVDYGRLSPLIVEAINEMKLQYDHQIKELNKKIVRLTKLVIYNEAQYDTNK